MFIKDIKRESFYDMSASDRYKETMVFIRSNELEGEAMCATTHLQEKGNEHPCQIIEGGEEAGKEPGIAIDKRHIIFLL